MGALLVAAALAAVEERGPLTEDPSASRASALSAPPFDLTAIRDASTADCRFEGEHMVSKNGVLLRAYRVSYLSWEWRGREGTDRGGTAPHPHPWVRRSPDRLDSPASHRPGARAGRLRG